MSGPGNHPRKREIFIMQERQGLIVGRKFMGRTGDGIEAAIRRRPASGDVKMGYSLYVKWFPQARVFEYLASSWWSSFGPSERWGSGGLAGGAAFLRAGALRS